MSSTFASITPVGSPCRRERDLFCKEMVILNMPDKNILYITEKRIYTLNNVSEIYVYKNIDFCIVIIIIIIKKQKTLEKTLYEKSI